MSEITEQTLLRILHQTSMQNMLLVTLLTEVLVEPEIEKVKSSIPLEDKLQGATDTATIGLNFVQKHMKKM